MLASSLRYGLVATLALAAGPSASAAPKKNVAKPSAKISDAKPQRNIAKPSAPVSPPPAQPTPAQPTPPPVSSNHYSEIVTAALKTTVVGGNALDQGSKFRGVGVRTKGMPELLALQNFTLRYESPTQGRPRGIGVEPVRPGIRYDLANADDSFLYTTRSDWQGLQTHAKMRHVTAICGLRSLCKVDVTHSSGEIPVLAGFAFRFRDGKELKKITIAPDPTHADYVVQVDAAGSDKYTVDLYLALVDSDVVVKTEAQSATRSGAARFAAVAQIDQFDPKPGQRRVLQGFSVEMTDGAHPVAELSISGIGGSGPAQVVFQDAAGNRPMKATLWWALVR